MTDLALIKRYLPEEVWEIAGKYDIPEDYIIDMPELISLILKSKSIDTAEEKQNWFNLLPLMNNEQIDRLNEILQKEKVKLAEIEKKYEEKKIEIKKKYLLKWQQMGYIKKVNQIREQEAKDQANEQSDAEKLLDMI